MTTSRSHDDPTTPSSSASDTNGEAANGEAAIDAGTTGASGDLGATSQAAEQTHEQPHEQTHEQPSAEKPVEQWVTGDEPMTGPQRSYLQTLAQEAGEDLPTEELTKAAASELIERLQRATGRIPADRQR